jgi:hypothetical protein
MCACAKAKISLRTALRDDVDVAIIFTLYSVFNSMLALICILPSTTKKLLVLFCRRVSYREIVRLMIRIDKQKKVKKNEYLYIWFLFHGCTFGTFKLYIVDSACLHVVAMAEKAHLFFHILCANISMFGLL